MKLHCLESIQKELTEGKYSVESLVRSYLSNIENSTDYNAYVEVFAEEALCAARVLDLKIRNNPNELGLLFGAVISIKDNLCYKDHIATAGSKMLNDFKAPYNSTAVDRLLKADAIIIGRTNCDEFSMGSTSETSFYGPVKNAIDSEYVAGGSSGGAAVAVQKNTCIAGIGSDTGGSVRQPASFNGVLGYKPSYGLISRWGLIAYGSSFDVIGVLAKKVNIIAKITDIISGPDDFDSTAIQDPSPAFNIEGFDVKDKKVAYLNEMLDHPKLNESVRKSFDGFVDKLIDKGVEVNGETFKYTDFLVPTYYVLCTAEASSNLSRFDGVRYGHRTDSKSEDYKEMIQKSRTEGFGKEVKKRIILGNYVLSEGHYDAYFTKAMQVRQIIKKAIDDLFCQYDFLILPTTTTHAWKIGDVSMDPVETYLSDMYTVLANLCGNPTFSIPLTNNNQSLPLGIQVMAKSREDKALFEFVSSVF